MFKKLIVFLFLLITILTTSSILTVGRFDHSDYRQSTKICIADDKELITNIIQEYINLKYQSLCESDYKDFSHLLDMSVDSNQFEVENIKYKIECMEYNGKKLFSKYNLDIQFDKLNISKDKADAEIILQGDGVKLHIYPIDMALGKHTISLNKAKGHWLISKDDYKHVIFGTEGKKLNNIEELRKDYKQRIDKTN